LQFPCSYKSHRLCTPSTQRPFPSSKMSGLEIIALLPTIVSAFGAISVEYRDWRKQRADRAHQRRNLHLQRSLAGNVGTVQGEFDESLRAVGPALRKGDGMLHTHIVDSTYVYCHSPPVIPLLTLVAVFGTVALGIARETLMNHLIILQSTVISLLRDRQNDASHLIHPNHDSIHGTTTSTRDGIITALAEQCQRLAQAKPIPRIQALTPHTPVQSPENCLEPLRCEYVESDTNSLLFSGLGVLPTLRVPHSHYSFTCDRCKWHGIHVETWPLPTTKDGHMLDVKIVLDGFHYRDSKSRNNRMGLRCPMCRACSSRDGPEARWKGVVRHIREKHYLEEFQPI
jgi:hypothetical protein